MNLIEGVPSNLGNMECIIKVSYRGWKNAGGWEILAEVAMNLFLRPPLYKGNTTLKGKGGRKE